MRKRILLFTIVAGFSYTCLLSNASGPGKVGNGNRTGSPGSAGTCASSGCHTGGSGTTTAIIEVRKKSDGTVATKYHPDSMYTVTLSGTNASLAKFGFQVIALKKSNISAGGTFMNLPTGTQVSSTGAGNLVEHSMALAKNGSGNYEVSFDWKAPATGADSIRFYGIINAVNGNNAVGGDQPSATAMKLLEDASGIVNLDGKIKVSTYPNPFRNSLEIKMEHAPAGDYSMQIRDLSGRVISSGIIQATTGTTLHSINTQKWANGVYIVHMTKDGMKHVTTVVKN